MKTWSSDFGMGKRTVDRVGVVCVSVCFINLIFFFILKYEALFLSFFALMECLITRKTIKKISICLLSMCKCREKWIRIRILLQFTYAQTPTKFETGIYCHLRGQKWKEFIQLLLLLLNCLLHLVGTDEFYWSVR